MAKERYRAVVPSITSEAMFNHLTNEDALGAVVRGHLHLEGFVNAMLAVKVVDTKALSRLSLDYDHKVDLLAALGFNQALVPPLKAIGKLRNKFAHDLETKMQKDVVDNLYGSLGSFETRVLKESKELLGKAAAELMGDDTDAMDIRARFAIWIVFVYSLLLFESMKLDFGEW